MSGVALSKCCGRVEQPSTAWLCPQADTSSVAHMRLFLIRLGAGGGKEVLWGGFLLRHLRSSAGLGIRLEAGGGVKGSPERVWE